MEIQSDCVLNTYGIKVQLWKMHIQILCDPKIMVFPTNTGKEKSRTYLYQFMGLIMTAGLKINEMSFETRVKECMSLTIYTYNNDDERPGNQINSPYFHTFWTIIYHYFAHLTKQIIPIKITIMWAKTYRLGTQERKDLEPQDNFLCLRGQFLYPRMDCTLQASISELGPHNMLGFTLSGELIF